MSTSVNIRDHVESGCELRPASLTGHFTISGRMRQPKRQTHFLCPAVAKNDVGTYLVFFGTGDELNRHGSDKFYVFTKSWIKERQENRSGQGIWIPVKKSSIHLLWQTMWSILRPGYIRVRRESVVPERVGSMD